MPAVPPQIVGLTLMPRISRRLCSCSISVSVHHAMPCGIQTLRHTL